MKHLREILPEAYTTTDRYLLETTAFWFKPHKWWSLLNREAQRAYLQLHKSKLRLTPQQQYAKDAAQTEVDIVREKSTFERIRAEHELHAVAKTHGIHLPQWLTHWLHTAIVGLVAFTTVLNSLAIGQETYRVNPDIYTGRIEQVAPKQHPAEYWHGYHMIPNHANPQDYINFWKTTNLKLPPHIIKMVKEAKANYDKMNLTPIERRASIIVDVNEWVNNNIHYMEFKHGWRTPSQIFTETKQKTDGKYYYFGDCKDYVIAKLAMLHEFGLKGDKGDIVAIIGVNEVKNVAGTPDGTFGHIMMGVLKDNTPGLKAQPKDWVFLDINEPKLKADDWIVNPQPYNGMKFIPLVLIDHTGPYNLVRYKIDPAHPFENWKKTGPYKEYFKSSPPTSSFDPATNTVTPPKSPPGSFDPATNTVTPGAHIQILTPGGAMAEQKQTKRLKKILEGVS